LEKSIPVSKSGEKSETEKTEKKGDQNSGINSSITRISLSLQNNKENYDLSPDSQQSIVIPSES
jgi:hypothetical protein